jgi:fructosamine-3-kinase
VTQEVRAELETEFGTLCDVRQVSGGCISPSYQVTLSDDRKLFVKTARPGWHAEAFAQEAASLEAIRSTQTLVVPVVQGVASSWLALAWLEPRAATSSDWPVLGAGLARMHRARSADHGWDADNFIGPLPQPNSRCESWAGFWSTQRLQPLIERAAASLERTTVRDFGLLLDELDERLAGAENDGASLLHGDLWGGNVHISVAGAGVIDPASYYGHREVDLAMAALFGGFPEVFFEAYQAEWPLQEGAARRRPIYQLYYLLVHVVLFGGSYASSTATTLRAVLR